MLVLSRRIGQTLEIGDDIRVTVVGCRGSNIAIGIEAPKAVPVKRSEVRSRIPDRYKDVAGNDADKANDTDASPAQQDE